MEEKPVISWPLDPVTQKSLTRWLNLVFDSADLNFIKSVSVNTAHGFSGTSSGGVNPILTISQTRYILFKVLDAATSHTVSTAFGGDLEIPFTGTITEIGAYVDTAGTTGTATIDVNINGTTIMTTTKISIDSTEKSSRTAGAPALTTTAITAGDIITVDIDAIHTTPAKGLTIRLGIIET